MKKILVAIGSRANYASLKSAMSAIQAHPLLDLRIVAYSTAVLDRFGDVASQIQDDGFQVDHRLFTHFEGETPSSMALSAASALNAITPVLESVQPDYMLLVGDRYEVLPAAIASSYMNVRVAHTMGGELTGTIDESIRHSITKLSHVHFAATEESAKRLARMGEDPANVHRVGCPRIDLAADLEKRAGPANRLPVLTGVGAEVDLAMPFVMVSQHPVTTEYDKARRQMESTLEAVSQLQIPAVVLWPNSDAGGAIISATIRRWRERNPMLPFRFVKNLPAEDYMTLMQVTKCLIGNSSSGLREGSYLGTPVVNIGSRQLSREVSENVIAANPDPTSILTAITQTFEKPRSKRSYLYGRGDAGLRIAAILADNRPPDLQKKFFEPSPREPS